MNDLIEALTIFLKYLDDKNDAHSVTHCEHDVLSIMGVGAVNAEDAKRLDELGFFWNEDEDVWQSFRFGSA